MKNRTSASATLIGTVQDVSGASVSVRLNNFQFSGLTFVDGQAYRIGQPGSFVKIPIGYTSLFGIVTQVGAGAVPEALLEKEPFGHRWLRIQLVGEGDQGGSFHRGIAQYPTIEDEVHLVSENDLAGIYGQKGKQNHLVKVGHIAGAESIDALVDINKLVTRHSAVVGTTGSGKSTTVASLLSALSNVERFPSARIVVIDLHGEYGKALGDRANIYRISPDPRNANEKPLYLPYWAMSFDELLKVTFGDISPESKARNIILEKILHYKSEALKAYPKEGASPDSLNVDTPVPFSLHELWHELYCAEFGTYYSDTNKKPEPENWAFETNPEGAALRGDAMAGIAPVFKKVKNLTGDPEKINYLPNPLNIRGQLENLGAKLRIPRFDFFLKPGPWAVDSSGKTDADLADLMEDWIGSEKPITILDLSGVPHSITNDVIGILLRIFYDGLFWARNLSQGGRERPLLLVMEEAHNYLNESNNGLASSIVQRIVKEGRKYGIGAMVVSQRPSEINPTILSQCGTFFALRLNNAADRSHVTGTLSDNLDGLTNMLSILRTGEAIIVGEAVGLPMRANIIAPPIDRRPDSLDPIVCDDLPPDISMVPGGWGIRLGRDSKSYQSLTTAWRRQNPNVGPKIREE
ncbi:ATP-binding protein [Gimibacter soli]|uniref:ATP-binding protein n=1 Tax=Gimibacter soli TaxID=3024400 RepID=A0AAE9XRZ3_9PROT|nr:ATP-binding protein [Gimibacter soli]WCL52880.1 ATP-binding protein [Gimibacter soli]